MGDFEVEVLTLAYHETPTSLADFLATLPATKYQVCRVTECLTTSEACKLMSRDWFGAELIKKVPSLVAIRVEIDEKLNVKQAKQPRAHEFDKWPRMLLSYESTTENMKVVYWRNRGCDEFMGLELGVNGESLIVADFVVDFIIEALCVNRSVTLTSDESPLTHLFDSYKTNLLIKSILDENLRIFRELIKFPFDINHSAFVGTARVKTTAADIALQQRDYAVLLELLLENSMYPSAFNIDEVEHQPLKAIVKLTTDLHGAIKASNQDEVIKILQQNSNLRHFYDTANVSAVATALKSKNIELYKVLLDHDVSFGPLEDVSGILKRHVPKEMRTNIRDLNSKVAKGLADRHLMTIFAKSVIAYDNQDNKKHTDLIKNALRDLNEIPIGHDLLQLSAHNEKLKIHFDFNQQSVMRMDPVSGKAGTSGLFYSENSHVYIAAKDSQNEGGARQLMAVLSHELCHLGVNLVFRNGVDPYGVDDEQRQKQFAAIIAKCEKLKDHEDIVRWVYECYPKTDWAAELIVRVPHMLVYHHDDPARCRDLRDTYSELFEYFFGFVAPQMMKTVVLLDKIARKSFSVNCAVLTDPLKNAIYESVIEFQGQEIEFSEIVDRDSEVFNHLKHTQMREILNCTEVLKIGEAPVMNETFIERSFIDFEVETERSENGWSETVKNNVVGFKKIAVAARSAGLTILADHAGAGKTTALKYLSVKLNSKYTDHYVAFIELKQHIRIFEKFTPNFAQIDSKGKEQQRLQIVELFREILSLTDELDAAVFTSLFSSNQVILLLDGFDEICPKFRDFLVNLVELMRKLTKNQLWLSTRPQHMKELKQKFRQRPFKLLPFDEQQKRELIGDETAVDVLKFTRKSLNGIDNPQMLRILAEIHRKAPLQAASLISVVDLMIAGHKRVLVRKNNEIASLERDPEGKLNIWQVLQVNALKLMFKEQFEDFLEPKSFIKLTEFSLVKKYQSVKHKWTPEAIARYGLLYFDNWGLLFECPFFVHAIFAEFFVAKFLIENIFEADDDDVGYEHMVKRMKLLIYVVENGQRGETRVVMDLLREYFEMRVKNAELNRFCSNLQKSKKNPEILRFIESAEMQKFIESTRERQQFWREVLGKL